MYMFFFFSSLNYFIVGTQGHSSQFHLNFVFFFLEKWMVNGLKKRNLRLIVTGSEMLPGLLMWGYLSALLLRVPR